VADVFISYAREDAAQAEQLASALEAAGHSCWWDRNLTPGTRYLAETEAQLKAARAVVVIWSRVSITSHWVADEAAVGRDENRLVALSFDGAMPPLGFRQFQVADLSGWQGDGAAAAFRNLLSGLERLVPRGPSAGPAPAPATPAQTPAVRGNLPRRLAPLIGREAELAQIASLLKEAPLVTLTGPGGIGKTRLAIEAAQREAGAHADGAFLVELAGVSDAAGIPGAVARAMGIELRSEPDAEIIERLRAWQALIVLDNCEHLIEAAAGLIERVLQQAPEVRVLATSQEILGLEGEQVLRLRSLDEADAEKLFLRAARAADPEFMPKPSDAAMIRAICARLDGVALAIEMAAARAPAIGCAELLRTLDDRFRVLTAGRRTALPRQRTLQATLDWSHSLLAPAEATVFRRLAVFAGGCTLEAARGVIAGEALDAGMVSEALAVLNRKSLVVIDRSEALPRYRLLETMRAYAQQKLAEAGETQALQRRHAEYFSAFFEPTLGLRLTLQLDRFGVYRVELANLVVALEWAFSPMGDVDLACELVAHGCGVFILQDRMDETVHWADRALSSGAKISHRLRSRLSAEKCWALTVSGGINSELLADIEQMAPAGSDPLVRTLVLVTSVLASAVLQRDLDTTHIRTELKRHPQTELVLRHSELIRATYLQTQDPARFRAATASLFALAAKAPTRDLMLFAAAQGSGPEVPWEEDGDKAIDIARKMLSDALDGEAPAFLSSLRLLKERLVFALCERNAPGDLNEARALEHRLLKLCPSASFDEFCHRAMLALAGGRPIDSARLLGWAGRRLVRPYPRFFSSVLARIEASILGKDIERAMAEGASLTPQQAAALSMGPLPPEGGAHG
jgi:predicted ATPase